MSQLEYRTHVALTYNVTGQTIEYYPPIEEIIADSGPPSAAATYAVFRGSQSNDETPILSGTATLDSVSTTLQSIAGPSAASRSSMQLTSASGVVIGRRYLLTNIATNGSQCQVIIPKLISSTTINHEADVWTDFTLLSTFKGLRHVFTVSSSFLQDSSNINIYGTLVDRVLPFDTGDTATSAPPYRVRWTYTTAGGVTRTHWTTFDLCRAPAQHHVTVEHVRAMVPDVIWDEWTQQRGQDFGPQIHESFERLRFDIRMAGYDPNMVTDPLVMDRLTTLAAVARIMRALDKDQNGDYEKDYRNSFEKAIGTGLRAWMQTDSSGGITPNPIRQLWLER